MNTLIIDFPMYGITKANAVTTPPQTQAIKNNFLQVYLNNNTNIQRNLKF